MHWANFLHFYQPVDQQPDILEAVVSQSYRPLFEWFKKNKHARLTINVSGALLELFDKYGYHDLIDMLRGAGKEGRIEFTGSAKYHALLPLLSEDEILRQILANDETNKFFLGDAYNPKGFFPPEMAYTEKLPKILEGLGYEWIIIDQIAGNGKVDAIDYSKLYKIKGSKLHVFFRERRVGNLIMGATVRTVSSLKEAMRDELSSHSYLITGMDGETFGHHRPGLENFFFNVFDHPEFNLIKISDVSKFYKKTLEITPIQSTWASSTQDIERGVQFLSWSDPENIVHAYQHELLKLTLDAVQAMNTNDPGYLGIRQKMDAALASDHFWWASAKPWWSIEMIEVGAYRLLDVIRSIPDIDPEKLEVVSNLYEKIVSTAFDWQRTGKVRKMLRDQNFYQRIPFKDRTVGVGGEEEGVYHAFIDMLARLEKESAAKEEYEKAILWRDAQYKLEHRQDVYDSINIIDLVRLEIPNKEVEDIIEKYKEQYRKIRGGQPEQRG